MTINSCHVCYALEIRSHFYHNHPIELVISVTLASSWFLAIDPQHAVLHIMIVLNVIIIFTAVLGISDD